jgi:exodeoxyribonuclease VII small subunit
MSKKSTPSFDEAMEELDSLVNQMESDQLPLEELISHYERGAKLLSECETTLTSAKKRLETIKNGGTKGVTKAATKASNNTPSSSDDDEIRLF